MSLRHDVYTCVQQCQPIGRDALIGYFEAKGCGRRLLQTTLSRMLSDGHLHAAGEQRHSRLLSTGPRAMPPPRRYRVGSEQRRRKSNADSRALPVIAEQLGPLSPIALHPIWPAVAGAPIGGLTPCIG